MPDKRVTELDAIASVVGTDLVMVVDDPAGTPVSKKATVNQVLVDVARTNVSNTFSGDQTVDGDLFVTGEVNPTVLLRQLPKINQLTGTVGDPSGSRTLMSQSLTAGLSLRHDEGLGHGRVAVGNYDTQLYQPLLFEVESLQVHTGVSPGVRLERVRVHPGGGVTVGDHAVDPGVGGVRVGSLDLREGIPLDPSLDTARLYALDVNGYTQVEMRDGNAKVVRFASDNILIAKATGATFRGQCIYLSGASGANPLIGLARADTLATMPAVGLALDAGMANDFIRVLLLGTFQLLDTSAFAEGARLYVSPTTEGALTTTRPGAPAYAQRVGVVTRSHATQGEVLVLTTAVEVEPRQHRATHEPGGADALTALDAAILTTGTLPDARLSASVLKYAGGYPGGTANYLRADGTFAAPAGGVPSAHATMHSTGGSDPVTVTALAGYPGGTANFLRADGTFAAPPVSEGPVGPQGPAGATGPAGVSAMPCLSGLWQGLFPYGPSGAMGAATIAANQSRLTRTVLGFNVQAVMIESSAAAAGAKFRVVVYTDTATGPGALVAQTPDLDGGTAGMKSSALSFAAGAYWIGVHNITSTAGQCRSTPIMNPFLPGVDTPGVQTVACCWQAPAGTSPPDPWPTTGITRVGQPANVYVQAS